MRGVVIYPNRRLDTADIKNYSEFVTSKRVSRIYLNELGETASLPVAIATIKLVVDEEETAITSARQLIDRTQQEINIEPQRRQLPFGCASYSWGNPHRPWRLPLGEDHTGLLLLELIETILVYKFPAMSREEIEGMFGLSDLKQINIPAIFHSYNF